MLILTYIFRFIIYDVCQQKERIQSSEHLSQGITEISIWVSSKNVLNKLHPLILVIYIIVVLSKALKMDHLHLSVAHKFVCWVLFCFQCFFPRTAMSWLWILNNEEKLYSSGHNFNKDILRRVLTYSICKCTIILWISNHNTSRNKCQ